MLNSIRTNNQAELVKNLEQYKERGLLKFDKLLSIPVKDRLPGLVEQYGKNRIHDLLIILVTEFANSFNLIRPMTPDQVMVCAYVMIETSYEDHLSIEDFTLFFQGAKSAKYGRVLDRMDQQTIFELFENYREQRHQQYVRIRDEKEVNLKGLGPQIRISEDGEKELKELFHEANLEYFKMQVKEEKPEVK